MAKYSPVGSVELLLELQIVDCLQDYLLLLAHEVFRKPELYKDLLKHFKGTIILDNSLIELGKPVSPGVMLLAAQIVKPSFVVLPDKLDHREDTVKMSCEALDTWVKDLPQNTGVMVAAQGVSPEDALWCVDMIFSYKSCPQKFLVGVPRNITNVQGSRMPLVKMLTANGYSVHLLGMSENLEDDIECALMPGVLGIDSASPLRAGWEGLQFDGKTTDLKDRNLFFKECHEVNTAMCSNVKKIQNAIRG